MRVRWNRVLGVLAVLPVTLWLPRMKSMAKKAHLPDVDVIAVLFPQATNPEEIRAVLAFCVTLLFALWIVKEIRRE